MCECVCAHMREHVSLYVCMYVCAHMREHVCLYVCVCVCVRETEREDGPMSFLLSHSDQVRVNDH